MSAEKVRLKEFIEDAIEIAGGIEKLAIALDVPKARITGWVFGRSTPSLLTLKHLEAYVECRGEWKQTRVQLN